MAINHVKLIEVMKSSVGDVERRYARYHEDLFDHVAQVVMLEREHKRQATQIQKRVTDKVHALAKLIETSTEDGQ